MLKIEKSILRRFKRLTRRSGINSHLFIESRSDRTKVAKFSIFRSTTTFVMWPSFFFLKKLEKKFVQNLHIPLKRLIFALCFNGEKMPE